MARKSNHEIHCLRASRPYAANKRFSGSESTNKDRSSLEMLMVATAPVQMAATVMAVRNLAIVDFQSLDCPGYSLCRSSLVALIDSIRRSTGAFVRGWCIIASSARTCHHFFYCINYLLSAVCCFSRRSASPSRPSLRRTSG